MVNLLPFEEEAQRKEEEGPFDIRVAFKFGFPTMSQMRRLSPLSFSNIEYIWTTRVYRLLPWRDNEICLPVFKLKVLWRKCPSFSACEHSLRVVSDYQHNIYDMASPGVFVVSLKIYEVRSSDLQIPVTSQTQITIMKLQTTLRLLYGERGEHKAVTSVIKA